MALKLDTDTRPLEQMRSFKE